MYLIVLVVDDPYHCKDILVAWEKAGVPGATILESFGLDRALRSGARDDIPLLPNLGDIMKGDEQRHRTIFSVVRDQETIDRVIEATKGVIGPLEKDNTGFLFVTPVTAVYGMRGEE